MSQPVHELLSEAEVEALFVGVTTALCVTIILDGVDGLPEGYRIRSHDSYGPLPDIEIDSTHHNIEQVLDRICLSTAKLGATVRFRCELATQAHDCQFIIPTSTGKVTVGVTVQPADKGDTATMIETLITAAEQVETA
jgi:hypothetical protein